MKTAEAKIVQLEAELEPLKDKNQKLDKNLEEMEEKFAELE